MTSSRHVMLGKQDRKKDRVRGCFHVKVVSFSRRIVSSRILFVSCLYSIVLQNMKITSEYIKDTIYKIHALCKRDEGDERQACQAQASKRTPAKKKSTEPSICWRGRRALLTPGVRRSPKNSIRVGAPITRRLASFRTCSLGLLTRPGC